MKKSSFVALVLGTVSGVLFALGMCMALLREWNSFGPGVAMGCAGVVLSLATVVVWRKMEHRQPVRLSAKAMLAAAAGIAGALALGVGMCLCMVWDQLVPGVIVGLTGIAVLLCLVPLTGGIKD